MSLTSESALRKDHTTRTPAMQHRHFAAVARVIADMDYLSDAHRWNVADDFANMLTQSNPNFDRDRFMSACGL